MDIGGIDRSGYLWLFGTSGKGGFLRDIYLRRRGRCGSNTYLM